MTRPETSRREFLGRAAGALALGAGGSWALAAPEGDAEWAFPLLGDLHFDRPEHHDLDWLRQTHPGDVAQVENYTRITRERTPRLLDVVRRQAAESRAPFVVQLGDLLEGLCGSEGLARRQAEEAVAFVRSAGLAAPFLLTKGNHDVTGPGAAQAYDRVLVPFMAGQAGADVRSAAFARERGGVLLVFYDAYDRGSLDWFAALLRDRRPGRLLFVIHPPVVPYNARSTWHVYARPAQEGQRRRLLELLGGARAVVLCGHLHKYSFLVRRTEAGPFTQLALSSVASTEDARPRDQFEGVRHYGPDLVNLEPRHSPDTADERRRVLEAERPHVEQFEYADTWGHALVRVRRDQVRADVYRGLSREPWKSLDLTGPVG